MQKIKIAIIGAGLAGLSSGMIILNQFKKKNPNLEIQLEFFEQNQDAGGKASILILETKKGNFRFDKGPSLVTMKNVFEEIFNLAGSNFDEEIKLKKLDKSCQYFFEDETKIDFWEDKIKLAKELESKLQESQKKINKFFKDTQEIYKITSPEFLYKDKRKFYLNPSFWLKSLTFWKVKGFQSMHKNLKKYFSNPKTIQIFSRYATYNGSSPYKLPATFNLISHIETFGTYIPENGIYQIPQKMKEINLQNGAKFNFNSKIKGLKRDNNKWILDFQKEGKKGVLKESEEKEFDYIICNIDPVTASKTFLKKFTSKENKERKFEKRSTSSMVFYWAIDKEFNDLDIHNIFFSKNYKQEFDELENGKIPDDPTIYVNISSKKISKDAPKKTENWFVMINLPAETKNINWQKEVSKIRENIIQKLNKNLNLNLKNSKNSLKEYILAEEVLTPEDLERKTGAFEGSLYGENSNSIFSVLGRKNLDYLKLENLYFASGTVHPGGGMPLAILSGKFAAQEIISNFEKNKTIK